MEGCGKRKVAICRLRVSYLVRHLSDGQWSFVDPSSQWLMTIEANDR